MERRGTDEVDDNAAIGESASGVVEVSLAVREVADVDGLGVGEEKVTGVGEGIAEGDDRSEEGRALLEVYELSDQDQCEQGKIGGRSGHERTKDC